MISNLAITEGIINPQSEASYIIYQDGNTINAKNGITGKIDYSGIDAASVINSTINTLINGGKIFIKAGIYNMVYVASESGFGYAIGVNNSNIIIEGEKGTILYLNNYQIHCSPIVVMSGVRNVIIRNFIIDGNKYNQIAAQNHFGIGIVAVGGTTTENITIDNCEVKNCERSGIAGATSTTGIVNNVKIYNCDIHHNEEGGINFSTAQTNNVSYLVIRDNLIHDQSGEGILPEPNMRRLIIENNYFYNNTTRAIGDSSNVLSKESLVRGNVFFNNGPIIAGTPDKIKLDDIYVGSNTIIEGNFFLEKTSVLDVYSGGSRINCAGFNTNIIIKGNIFTQGYIPVDINADNVIFTENQITSGCIYALKTSGSVTKIHNNILKPSYRIFVAGSTSTDIEMTDNNIGAPFGTIPAFSVVRNNTGYKTENRGSLLISDSNSIFHGLVSTPTYVNATPSIAGELVSVTSISLTTFTVAIKKRDGTPGTTQTIYWNAEV